MIHGIEVVLVVWSFNYLRYFQPFFALIKRERASRGFISCYCLKPAYCGFVRLESSMDYNEFRYLYYATFVIPFLSCIPPKTPPVRYKDTERRMTMPTNSQIEGMYGAIKELRTSLNAFEHLVSAHLDEFGKQVKQLEQNTCTNPKEDKQRESGKRSALTAQPHVRLLASNEAQELSAPPLIKKQTHKIEKPSARNVQREGKHHISTSDRWG